MEPSPPPALQRHSSLLSARPDGAIIFRLDDLSLSLCLSFLSLRYRTVDGGRVSRQWSRVAAMPVSSNSAVALIQLMRPLDDTVKPSQALVRWASQRVAAEAAAASASSLSSWFPLLPSPPAVPFGEGTSHPTRARPSTASSLNISAAPQRTAWSICRLRCVASMQPFAKGFPRPLGGDEEWNVLLTLATPPIPVASSTATTSSTKKQPQQDEPAEESKEEAEAATESATSIAQKPEAAPAFSPFPLLTSLSIEGPALSRPVVRDLLHACPTLVYLTVGRDFSYECQQTCELLKDRGPRSRAIVTSTGSGGDRRCPAGMDRRR